MSIKFCKSNYTYNILLNYGDTDTDTDTDNLFSIENHKHLQIRNKMKIIKVN